MILEVKRHHRTFKDILGHLKCQNTKVVFEKFVFLPVGISPTTSLFPDSLTKFDVFKKSRLNFEEELLVTMP